MEVFFLDGLIVHVMANYRSKKDLLGEILLKAKKISQDQLEKVLKLQAETLQYAGEIMVDLKILTEEEIIRVISTQVYETIYDLLTWKEGEFRFELRAVESYKKISIALSPEHVLLNVLRMIDEWPDIESKISSLYVVFRKVKPLPENQEEFSPEKRVVYDLTDGNLTLREVIDRSLLGKFNACEAMVDLWDKGYVERVGIRKPSFTRMMGAKVGLGSFKSTSTLVTYGMVLAISIALVFSARFGLFSEAGMSPTRIALPRSFVKQVASEGIRKALTLYYLENGEYPDSLEDLVDVGLIPTKGFQSELSFSQLHYKKVKHGGYILTLLASLPR
ncbi:MAG: DUF4388 domain-containing protein [Deltaproteobacteria bacterium]|nr:DUF4388 domain-containing protein [Deltaproteobacteria bacterium]